MLQVSTAGRQALPDIPLPIPPTEDGWWSLTRGPGPLVAVCLHAGHAVRPEVAERLALTEEERRREEDPFTDAWAAVACTRVVAHRSRFEVDFNRPRRGAVYRRPQDAWGLEVWRVPPDPVLVAGSLAAYDAFYCAMESLFADLERRHGRFLVLDLHTYNHRRTGPAAPPADPAANPEVNVGTGAHPPDGRWRPVVRRFLGELAARPVDGRTLDVRENVRFQGGHFARWAHRRFPASACVLALEFKKTFMDEWTGEVDAGRFAALRLALAAALPPVIEELGR